MACFKKQGLVITVLFCLLAAIAVLPVAMLHYNQSRLMGRVSVTAVPSEPEAQEESSQNGSALERIKALTQSNEIVVEKTEAMSEEQHTELIRSMEQQLSVLQSMGVLPQFAFSEQYRASFSKRSYMDAQNLNHPINICRIEVSYPSLLVNVSMDMDTSLLYEVSVYSESPNLIPVSENPSADGFLEYLHFTSEEAEKAGIRFDVGGYYSADISKLSFSVIPQHTIYDLEDSAAYVAVTQRPDNDESETVTNSTSAP